MSNKSLFQPKNVARIIMAGLLPFCSLMMAVAPVVQADEAEETASEQTYNFTLTNDTEETITELYVDDADEEEWGENIIGEAIAPGETATFEWMDEDVEEGDPCLYHVMAGFEDDSVADEVEEGIDFCENPEVIVTED
jgi:hypothetical protein